MRKLGILLLFVTVACSKGQSSSPKIYAPIDHFDFGKVVAGEIVKHDFEIQNTGNAELNIKNVSASCGCTAAKPEKSVLKPGEKSNINVSFNSSNRIGEQEKFIYVVSDDQQTPELKFLLKGIVVDKSVGLSKDVKTPKLVLLETQHDFGDVEEGKVVETYIEFKNDGQEVLTINDVKTSCGCTAALLTSKTLKPGEKSNVRIDLDTSKREGKLTRTVTLFSNDPSEANRTITIYVNITKKKQ
jgi:hypothetical protein